MYTENEKRIIRILKKANVNWKVISEVIQKKENALRKWWSVNSVNIELPPKTVIMKRMTDGRIGLAIKKLALEIPKIAIRDFESRLVALNFAPDAIPKPTTIQDYLSRNAIKVIKSWKKQFISDANIRKRLEFAQVHSVNMHPLLYETIWSDETSVRKAPKDKIIEYRCHSTMKKNELPINWQFQQGGFCVMFWGCFSVFGTGPLLALEGSQNQHTYIKLLEEWVLPEIIAAKEIYDTDMTFMQDNAPCHKTKKIAEFFEKNQIKTLNWPPQSPDINPIENLWSWVKRKRQKLYGMPKNKVELTNQIMQIWDEIDENLIVSLALSVEKRLEAVIKVGGRQTKY